MPYGKYSIYACVFSVLAVAAASNAGAQAYIKQVSPGGTGAYITQMPPSARAVETLPGPTKRTAPSAEKLRSKTAKAAFKPFPSVGQGSTAIVQADADATEWPTVGRGAVNK